MSESLKRSLYYATLLLISLAGVAYGIFFSELFFPSDKAPWIETAFTLLKCSWLIALPYAILNYYSLLRYPVFAPAAIRPTLAVLQPKLYFRFVTRGHNPNLIAETVDSACRALERTLAPHQWRVEVVTDRFLTLSERKGQVRVIVVPADYQLAKGTRYKARALHYALSASHAKAEDWIVHLDEETRFDEETVRAVAEFVIRETKRLARQTDQPKIAQGVVLYGKGQIFNWLTTLADSLRVGDDYGRFRLQFENGKAYFGMHGSFIVVNNRVENEIGFDHGFVGSITEDAYFALVAQSLGVKFEFIHAFMYEKSPFSMSDFVKQRRRWFGGLWLCALAPNIPLRHRLVLATFMVLWSISWLCIMMVYVNFFYPTGTPVWLGVTGGLSFSYYVLMYLVGYLRTFDWRESRATFVLRLLAQVFLIPVFSVMEAGGVFYALLSPPKDFYIVQKEWKPAAAPARSLPLLLHWTWIPRPVAYRLLGLSRQLPWLPARAWLRLQSALQRITMQDAVTGLYTPDYWLRALHLHREGFVRRPVPVMCLMLDVRGLELVRAQHGAYAANEALAWIGHALKRNLRAYDLLCRYHDQQFVAALLQCSPEYGQTVGQRVVENVSRKVVAELNQRFGSQLALEWRVAALPKERLDPVALSRTAQKLVEQPGLAYATAAEQR